MASPRRDFLLEVGTEPLPARFIEPAAAQLAQALTKALESNLIDFSREKTATYATPRRLAVLISGLPQASARREEKVKGPPSRLLKDAEGKTTPQAAGFAKKQGVDVDALFVEGEFIYARVVTPGRKTAEALREIVPAALKSLAFPKVLEWEPSRFKFGRPVRALVAVFGTDVVPMEIAGVKSGRATQGLAALQGKPVRIASPGAYERALAKAHVIADPALRRQALLERLEKAAAAAGGRLDLDEALVVETVFMTEQPRPIVASFDEKFLALPQQLLALVLKRQLKFFPVLKGGRLLPAFVGVRDGLAAGEALVREGYQRVLAARGNDAVFFFNRDLAARLETRLPLLERVTYQKSLGTMAQKGQRVLELTRRLCETIRQDMPADEEAAVEIARLCYADLVTDVVKEFPELQGVMGGVYARHDGLDERVALGLEQFYLPSGPKSPVPTTIEGALASLAGKLDALAGNFAIGQAPTGSADPFALRRQALGAIRIALEHQLPLDLGAALSQALSLQPASFDCAATLRELTEFLWGRAQSLFEEKGFRIDEIRSIKKDGLSSLPRAYMRLAAIHAVRQDPDFEPLAASFKRAANILRQAQFPLAQEPATERGALREEAEIALYDALRAADGQAQEKFLAGDYESGLKALVGVKPHLDRFFERVMVMAEEPELRRQRLGLLAKLVRLFNRAADLSEIQGSAPN